MLTDANGLPVTVAVSAANTNDHFALPGLVQGIGTVRSRRGPRRRKPETLRANKGYDVQDLRKWLTGRGIRVKIARRGIDSKERLGRHRWKVERTIAWLTGYRRLSPRYERDHHNYLAFLALAATITTYKKLQQAT